jgi:probable rRNA maturation factor
MTGSTLPTVRIEVQVEPLPADPAKLRKVAEAVLRRFRLRRAAVTITIVDDQQMRKVHKQFLNKSSTTDVMSFDLTDEFEKIRTFEVVVNAQMAARQARKHKHSAEAELALYITHGLLHQLGFDDVEPNRALEMHKTEDAILKKLGFGAIYYQNTMEN